MQFQADGRVDTTISFGFGFGWKELNSAPVGFPRQAVMDASDSAIVVVGGFTHFDGTEQPYIVRIITTGREALTPIAVTNTAEIVKNSASIQANTSKIESSQYKADILRKEVSIEAFPNPFSEQTQLRLTLPKCQFVRLSVHDALGRLVANLLEQPLEAGEYSVTLNAAQLPANGVYHYRAQTEMSIQSGVLVFVR